MAFAHPRTLDIREPQILRHFPADANAFYWHHRVLLHKVAPGVWIGLTPDEDLERLDLHVVDHLPLERRSDFPAPQAPYTYAFDDLSRADLDRHRRRAQIMAALFNDAPYEDMEDYQWIVCDTTSNEFGQQVPEDLVATGVTLGDSGIVTLDGADTFIKRVLTSKKAEEILSLDKSRGDCRIIGDYRDGQNKRFLSFNDALTHMTEEPMPDWPLQGPRVVLEFLRAIRSGPGDLTTYHLTWIKSSGVNSYSMVAHDHKVLCSILRSALETDQIAVVNSLAFELLVRRLVQMETAVARNSQNPDFSGLELMLEESVGVGGEAVTTTFNTWIASKLKEKANIAKQARLYKEEFRGTSAAGPPAQTEQYPRGRGRGKGKGRGQPKAQAGSPAQIAGAGAQN